MFSIKEIFYTLQGEGYHAGRPAIFCRFSGCNLWNGLEKDRSKAICKFCDTDFWGVDGENGGKYKIQDLADKINALWPENEENKFLVCTGGEPALQITEDFVKAMHKLNFEVAIETNGTLPVPDLINWICVSPKAGTEIVLQSGDELKIVFPQLGINPLDFEKLAFDHFFIQPMDNESKVENTRACVKYVMSNPQWKLSIQTHKILGIQ